MSVSYTGESDAHFTKKDNNGYIVAMRGSLSGKKAVVTGGSRGIGKAVAKAFLGAGASVTIVSRTSGELDAAARELKSLGEVKSTPADVSDEKDVERVAREVKKSWGEVDVLVNAAGVYGPIGLMTDNDPEEWKKSILINLFGTFLMTRYFAPMMGMESRGKIINFSGGGEGPYPNFSSYVASKGGVVRFTETIAAELKEKNIDVNAITPGPVNTKFMDDLLQAGPLKAGWETYDRALRQKQEGGVSPEKAAELCVFLASADADGITGKVISAVWDNYAEFPAHLKEIMDSDIFTFRRVKPEDRGIKL